MTAAMMTKPSSLSMNWPYGNRTPDTVKDLVRKSPVAPVTTPTSGVMKARTNEVMRAPKAAPMTTATARSTTLPRSRNFLKPSTSSPGGSEGPTCADPARSGRSGAGDQHARVEQALRVDRLLRRPQRPRERLRTLAVVPRPVVASDRVVMGDRPAGREDRLARRRLHLVPLRDLRAAASGCEDREVRRGAVGVDVRDPARHAAASADLHE